MLYETIGQEVIWLRMACFGMAGSIWYMLCAGLRRVMRAGVWLSLAVDSVCAMGLGGLFCAGLIFSLSGEFRLYALLAFCIGFALFSESMIPIVRYILCHIHRVFVKIMRNMSKNYLMKALFR